MTPAPSPPLPKAARDGKEDVVNQHLARLPRYKKKKVLDARDADGFTAMHYAAKFNRFKILRLLVDSDASELGKGGWERGIEGEG